MNEQIPLELRYSVFRFLSMHECDVLAQVSVLNRASIQAYYQFRLESIPQPITLKGILPELVNFDPFLFTLRSNPALYAMLCSLGTLHYHYLAGLYEKDDPEFTHENHEAFGLITGGPLSEKMGMDERTVPDRNTRIKISGSCLSIQWVIRTYQSKEEYDKHYQAFVALKPPAPILEKSKELLQNMSAGIKAKLTLFKDNVRVNASTADDAYLLEGESKLAEQGRVAQVL